MSMYYSPEEDNPDWQALLESLGGNSAKPAGATQAGSGDDTSAFLSSVDQVKKDMDEISKGTKQIEQKHAEALAAISDQQAQEASGQVDKLMAQVKRKQQAVRSQLKGMQNDINNTSDEDKGGALYKMQAQQHAALSKKFISGISDYNDIQNNFRQKYRDRVKRQFKIVKPDATDAEVDDVLDNNKAHQIFQQEILAPGHDQAKSALEEMEQNNKDLQKLEGSVKELNDLFQDMNSLLTDQGMMVNNIASNVGNSTDYTEKAVAELTTAKKHFFAARKMKYITFGIIFGVIALIAAILGVYFATRKK